MYQREWNPKSFFRHLTPEALKALQAWTEVDLALDGEGPLGEQVFRAWKALPENDRKSLESGLGTVNDMCAPHARPYLERLARLVWTDERAPLIDESRMWTAQDLAVRLFVADPRAFAEAHQTYAIDQMERFKEFRGRYRVTLKPTQEARAQMKEVMASHFRDTALGIRCQVEDFANDEKLALFVFHEVEVASVDRFKDEGVIVADWERLVIRLVAIFQFETSTLFIKAARTTEREKMRDLFARIFIGDAAYFEDTTNGPRFCFDRLLDPHFGFPTRVFDRIQGVSLMRVDTSPGDRDVKRVTVEMKPGLSLEGARRVLAERGVDLGVASIKGIRLRFNFEGKGPTKYRTVILDNPNSSNLNDSERDRIIQRCLKDWGIDARGREKAPDAIPEEPWVLVLRKLRQSNDARVSQAEVLAAGVEPAWLVSEGVLEWDGADGYEPDGCEHGCMPNINFDLRGKEGLVGVACPQEPACWPGWRWVDRHEVESLRCRAKDVFAALAGRNGLEPLTVPVPLPFVGIGLLRRRGLCTPVVWLRSAPQGFEHLCLGLRARLGQDGLIVLIAKDPRVRFTASDRIAVIELLDDARGDLRLIRALDELVPDYRTRVVADPRLDLDYVKLRFSTRPGERHVVEINGRDFEGFRTSDVKFLRLLLLAAARKNGKDQGWLDKSRLRDGDDRDRALGRMREELASYDVPGLSEAERKALVRAHKSQLRLGVAPENIEFDESLAGLEFIGANAKPTPKQEEGLQNAAVLLRDCRRLGVPGDVREPPGHQPRTRPD